MVLAIEPVAACALGKCFAPELQPSGDMQICVSMFLYAAPETIAECSHPLPYSHTVKQHGSRRDSDSHKVTQLVSQYPVILSSPVCCKATVPLHVSLPEGHLPFPITLQSQQLLGASSFVNGLVKHSAVKRSSLTISIQFL